jgi:hypothetical protein
MYVSLQSFLSKVGGVLREAEGDGIYPLFLFLSTNFKFQTSTTIMP